MYEEDEIDREAANPIRARLMRILRILGIVLAVAVVLGGSGYWFFIGWRARDLAIKARVNLEQGNYRVAWLEVNSARAMRPKEPEVLRSSALVSGAFGNEDALGYWRELGEHATLTQQDQEKRALVAIRFRDEESFDEALAALEKAGYTESVGRLKTVRRLARGDLDHAIEEARASVGQTGDASIRFDLAKLLLRRYSRDLVAEKQPLPPGSPAGKAFEELVAIVNTLRNDPVFGNRALALGLTYLLPGIATQKDWTGQVMQNIVPGNPALLPAATVMIDNNLASADDLNRKLRPVFDAAPVELRAAYAVWLSRSGLAREAVSIITAQEAAENPDAFAARAQALGQMGNWEAVIAAAAVSGNTPEYLRLLARARAESKLSRGKVTVDKTIADALRSAAREGALVEAVTEVDAMGGDAAADETLVELCGNALTAGQAFRLSRERFAREGNQDRLKDVIHRARVASPDAPAVGDYLRYEKMISDEDAAIDIPAAAAAVDRNPADPLPRVTWALALLRSGQTKESVAVFDNIDIDYDLMPPGAQAVICAVLAADGRMEEATAKVRVIERYKLLPGEAALISELR